MKTLEQLLTPKWRGFIKRLADALDAHDVEFAVIGAMALGKRAGRVRATEDIDILVNEESQRAVTAAMKDAGLARTAGSWPLVKYSDGLLEVDVLCGVGDPEESAIALAAEVPLFGRSVKVATRPFLLWMYLLSDQPRHHDDALNVIRAMNGAELAQLRMYLKHDNDSDALRLLARWTQEATKLPFGR
jgi:hypothetical protein